MSEHGKNVEIFGRFYTDVFTDGRLEVIDELIAPDFVEHEQLPPEVPPGVEGLKRFVQLFRTAFPDMKVERGVTLAEGDLVAGHVTFKGTHRGEFMGVAPTGRSVSFSGVDIVRFRDGKAVEHWGSSDMMSLMQQIGAIPAP